MENMRTKFNKEEAVAMREKGCTYLEISNLLGCSIDWCKKSLSGVEKGSNSVEKVVVDGTKLEAIAILEDALAKLKLL